MTSEQFKKDLRKLFIEAGTTERQVALKLGIAQQNLNRKINSGTVRAIEFLDILDMLGYEIEIKKKNDR